MADMPASFLVHPVAVRTRQGSNAFGDVYANSVNVSAFLEQVEQTVITPGGEQVAGVATLRTTAEGCNGTAPYLVFTQGSVAAWVGGSGRVVSLKIHDDGGLGAWQHTEVIFAETVASDPAVTLVVM